MLKTRLSLLFVLCLCAVAAFAQTNFYVSKTGNNANSGLSPAQAWKTIQHAMNVAPPNSVVNIMAGTYKEKLTLNVSGLPGQRILFRNHNSDVVTLNGGGVSGQTMLEIVNKNHVTVQGLRITNNQQLWAEGIRVEGNCQGIEIRDCRIWAINFSTNASQPANPSRNSNPLLVIGNIDNQPISGLVIHGNHIYSNRTGYSENLTVTGNVDGFEVTNNSVYNNKNIGIDIIGGYGEVADPNQDCARNGLVRGNICYNNKSAYATAAGIYVDGARNLVLENNTCYKNQWGIEVGAEEPGARAENIIVRNNLIYNNDESGLACGGYNFPSTGKVVNAQFYGNTLLLNDRTGPGEGEIFLSYSENCAFRQNIIFARKEFFLTHDGIVSPAPPTLDYNCWWRTGGNQTTAEFERNGVNYIGFANYRTATGQDAHSIFADPKLTSASASAPDAHLLAASPCINAGNPAFVSAPTERDLDLAARVAGGRVDIGADESGAPVWENADERNALTTNMLESVFPNPSSGIFQIRLAQSQPVSATTLRVFDFSGQLVFEKTGCQQLETIDLRGRPAGVYFLQIGGAAAQKLMLTH